MDRKIIKKYYLLLWPESQEWVGHPEAICAGYDYSEDDDLLLGVKIVYNKEYFEKEFPGMSNEDEIKQKIWEDIKEINKGLPTYKHIKQLIVTTEPMIKTTTNKVKRNEEIKLILGQ